MSVFFFGSLNLAFVFNISFYMVHIRERNDLMNANFQFMLSTDNVYVWRFIYWPLRLETLLEVTGNDGIWIYTFHVFNTLNWSKLFDIRAGDKGKH